MMDKDQLLTTLGEILAGLQVPLSIGGTVALGAAAEPYRKVLGDRSGFGYASAEDFTQYLRERLADPQVDWAEFARDMQDGSLEALTRHLPPEIAQGMREVAEGKDATS